MVELLKAIEEGLIIVIRALHGVGEFILAPGEGAAIAFTWIFSPLLAFAGIQKIKRMVLDIHSAPPGWMLEILGIMSCAFISWLLLVGLWNVQTKPWVHIFLICWCHMVTVNAWMNFLRKYCPNLFKAFRSRRRDADSKGPEGNYNADPDTTIELEMRNVSNDRS